MAKRPAKSGYHTADSALIAWLRGKEGFPAPELAAGIDQLGRMGRRKVCAAVAQAEGGHVLVGVYLQTQGRRPGRKHDFSTVYRLGGLVVDRTVAPGSCVIVNVRNVDALPNEKAWPWPVEQAVHTDGLRWRAWIKDEQTKCWKEGESFDLLPELAASTAVDGMTAGIPTVLAEYLRRVMMQQEFRPSLDTLARRLASHTRAQAGEWVATDKGRDRIHAFREELRIGLGLTVGTPLHAARVLAAFGLLDAIHSRIAARTYCNLQDLYYRMSGYMASISPATEEDVKRLSEAWRSPDGRTQTALHRLDGFLRMFFSELELTPGGYGRFSPELWSAADAQAGELLLAHSGALIDPNAGTGDYLLAAASRLAADGKPVRMAGAEAHPLALRVAALRLDVALTYCPLPDKPQISLWSRNVFRDSLPDMGAGAWIGESRPHVGWGERLNLGDSKAEPGWGGKVVSVERAAERLLEAALKDFSRGILRIACLRLPFTWAGDDEYMRSRSRLRADMNDLDLRVNTSGTRERPRDRRLARDEIVLWLRPKDAEASVPTAAYRQVKPRTENRHSWLPAAAGSEYDAWPSLVDIAAREPWNGPIERRGLALIDIDGSRLLARLQDYFGDLSDADIKEKYPSMMRDAARFPAVETRLRLRAEGFSPRHVETFSYRPFDDRFLYRHNARPLFSEPANELFSLATGDNFFLVASAGDDRATSGAMAWWGRRPADYDFFAGHSGHFPVLILDATDSVRRTTEVRRIANLSPNMRAYLHRLGYRDAEDPDRSRETAMLPWLHALAALHTPSYRLEYRERLRHGWPRIPFPGYADTMPPDKARERLEASAELGRQIADLLLNPDRPIDPSLDCLGRFFVNGQPVDPNQTSEAVRSVEVQWGRASNGNAVRPSRGRITSRPRTDDEYKTLRRLSETKGYVPDALFRQEVYDVWVSDAACWTGVAEPVWFYNLGGRQILKKWLAYRTATILGRSLSAEEVTRFTQTVRAQTRLLLLEAELERIWRQ